MQRCLSIVLVALGFCWPALWNRHPLLYPDSPAYIVVGRPILGKLLGHAVPRSMYVSNRSEIYSAVTYFLHWHAWFEPILMLNALLTAWLLWLVVRSLVEERRALAVYLGLSAVLSAGTFLSWYVSALLTDVFGPLAYLAIFLVVFERAAMSVWERRGLLAVVAWGAMVHGTHFALCLLLAGGLSVLWLVRWREMRGRGASVVAVVAVLVCVGLLQAAVHKRLYGKATLLGRPPAFLMSRLVEQYPARAYLAQNCDHLTWMICRYRNELPTVASQFLFPEQSIWRRSTWEEQDELHREEFPLMFATMRAYPALQGAIFWNGFEKMLFLREPNHDFDDWPANFAPQVLDEVTPGWGAAYAQSRQARSAMPEVAEEKIQEVLMLLCMAISLVAMPFLWRSDGKLVGLAALTWFVLMMNALLGSALSSDDRRLQDRIAWMIVMVAGLMVVRLMEHWRRA